MNTYLWEEGCEVYNYLLQNSCLCNFSKYDLNKWLEVFAYQEEERKLHFFGKSAYDFQLLNLAILRLTAEKYIHSASEFGFVCGKVAEVKLAICELWDKLVEVLCQDEDIFSSRALVKALSVCFFLFSAQDAKSKMIQLLDCAKTRLPSFEVADVLSLINLAMQYDVKDSHHPSTVNLLANAKINCKEYINAQSVLISDIKVNALLALSQGWNSFIENLFTNEDISRRNNILIDVFILWKTVNDMVIGGDREFWSSFLSAEHLSYLFCNDMKAGALKYYLDIVVQVLSVEEINIKYIEDALSKFLTSEFLEKLPDSKSQSCFCGSSVRRYINSEEPDADITCTYDGILLKKAVCVIFKMMSRMKDKLFVSAILCKVRVFLNSRNSYLFYASVHSWIVQFFLDHDDLLLDTMLSALKLYCELELPSEMQNFDGLEELRKTLNPHKMFLEFLSAVGKSHHVLLDFLMSNETCMLSYLLHYFKFINLNWSHFVDSYTENTPIVGSTNFKEQHEISVSAKNASDDVIQSEVKFDDKQPNLVSYSSTSSSGTENDCEDQHEIDSSYSSLQCTVLLFKNLRLAIEKLTKLKEFPYNAMPLLEQIRLCENKIL